MQMSAQPSDVFAKDIEIDTDAAQQPTQGKRTYSMTLVYTRDRYNKMNQISTTLICHHPMCADDNVSVAGSESTVGEMNPDAAAR